METYKNILVYIKKIITYFITTKTKYSNITIKIQLIEEINNCFDIDTNDEMNFIKYVKILKLLQFYFSNDYVKKDSKLINSVNLFLNQKKEDREAELLYYVDQLFDSETHGINDMIYYFPFYTNIGIVNNKVYFGTISTLNEISKYQQIEFTSFIFGLNETIIDYNFGLNFNQSKLQNIIIHNFIHTIKETSFDNLEVEQLYCPFVTTIKNNFYNNCQNLKYIITNNADLTLPSNYKTKLYLKFENLYFIRTELYKNIKFIIDGLTPHDPCFYVSKSTECEENRISNGKQIQIIRDQIKSIDTNYKFLSDRICDSNKKIKIINKKNETLKSEIDQKIKDLNNIVSTSLNSTIDDKITKFEGELSEHEKKIFEQRVIIRDLSSRLEESQNVILELKKKRIVQECIIKENTDVISKLQSQNEIMQKQINELKRMDEENQKCNLQLSKYVQAIINTICKKDKSFNADLKQEISMLLSK